MKKLEVTFGKPQHGWIDLIISNDNQTVAINADSKAESFAELVNALLGCLETNGDFVVTWLEEPNIAEMHFEKRNESITLRVFGSDVSNYPKVRIEPKLSSTGSYSEICLPFYDALHALQSRYSPQELEERMQDEFPTKQFASLIAQIELRKLQQK